MNAPRCFTHHRQSFTTLLALMALLQLARVANADTNLIPAGSTWRYLATGAAPGASWREAGFNDASWPLGMAKLGFGGDGEMTTIGTAASGFTTFYFRKAFTVTSAASFTNLFSRLVRDDGAVVYLNGVEAFRNNMPAGAIGHFTLAPAGLAAPEETRFVTNALNPALLLEGGNIVAVEIHQSATNSSDLGFELELIANAGLVLPASAVAITNAPASSNLVAGSNVTLNASASSPNGVARVDFYVNGGLYSQDAASPYQVTLRSPVAGGYTVVAVETDYAGLGKTSAPVNFTVPAAAGGVATLVPRGAFWKYFDGGFEPPLWQMGDFDDSPWPCGPAELGYGDGDEATGIRNTDTNGVRLVTAYFRHSFNVLDPSAYSSLLLRLRLDDGAAVYLNGVEVVRTNLPAGPLGYATNALAASADDGTLYFEFPVSATLLQQEANWLAVEVHQSGTNSSDLSFDLHLLCVPNCTNLALPLVLSASLTNGGVALSFDRQPGTFQLQSRPNLNQPSAWSNVVTIPGAASGRQEIIRPTSLAAEFFRLCLAPFCEACQQPVILTQTTATNVPMGSPLLLSAVAAGPGPLTYQWRKNQIFITGATNATLAFASVTRADGGSYDLIVGNACNCILGCVIPVTVGGTNVAPADNLASAVILSNASFELNSSTAFATREVLEPASPYQLPEGTIWFRWSTPVSAVALLDTLGSGSDTAVGIYTSVNLSNFTQITVANDSGPFHTSALQFNAQAGQNYYIGVSSLGLTRNVCLNGRLATNYTVAATIVQPPLSQTVPVGSNFTLTVQADATPMFNAFLTYQWLRNGVTITNATNSAFTVANAQFTNAHVYSVNVGFQPSVVNALSSTSSPPGIVIIVSSGTVGIPSGAFKNGATVCGVTWTKGFSLCYRVPNSSVTLNPTCDEPQLLPLTSTIPTPVTPLCGTAVGSTYPVNGVTYTKFYANTVDSSQTGIDTCLQMLVRQLSNPNPPTCPATKCTNDVPACVSSCLKHSHCTTSLGNCNNAYGYIKVNVFYKTPGCSSSVVPTQVIVNHAYLP